MEKGKKIGLFVGIAVILVIAIVVGIILATGNSGGSNSDSPSSQNGEVEKPEPTVLAFDESSLSLDKSYIKSFKWGGSPWLGTVTYNEVAGSSSDKDFSISVKLYEPIMGSSLFADETKQYSLKSGDSVVNLNDTLARFIVSPETGSIQVVDVVLKLDTNWWFVAPNPGDGKANILTYGGSDGYNSGGYYSYGSIGYSIINQTRNYSRFVASISGGPFQEITGEAFSGAENSNELTIRFIVVNDAEAKQVKRLGITPKFKTKGVNAVFELPEIVLE